MTRYFLGTDTGATKSHAIVADEHGNALGFGVAGPGNPQGIGFENLRRLLDDLTTQATRQANIGREQIAGVGFGIAGYDWPSSRPTFVDTVAPLGFNCPIDFANDSSVGLLAGSSEGWGVAVVSGTSSNCRGRDRQGREGRVTGHGWPFGEVGGAGELVMRAVQGVAFEWTRRGPKTKLTQQFMALTGASSQAARTVFQVANEGDAVAVECIRWVGEQLGDMANGVIRQLHLENDEFEVVLVGSLYQGGPLLIEPMRRAILAVAPNAKLVRLSAPPVIGGVLLGMELGGVNGWAVKSRLIETTNDLIQRNSSG
jgi:N-acetylglucosamine kinase-like BadF-type ATPase